MRGDGLRPPRVIMSLINRQLKIIIHDCEFIQLVADVIIIIALFDHCVTPWNADYSGLHSICGSTSWESAAGPFRVSRVPLQKIIAQSTGHH